MASCCRLALSRCAGRGKKEFLPAFLLPFLLLAAPVPSHCLVPHTPHSPHSPHSPRSSPATLSTSYAPDARRSLLTTSLLPSRDFHSALNSAIAPEATRIDPGIRAEIRAGNGGSRRENSALEPSATDAAGPRRRLLGRGRGGGEGGGRGDRPTKLTIFTAPRPFDGPAGTIQRLAIISWLCIDPAPVIYLLGNHPSFKDAETDPLFAGHVLADPYVDADLYGQPLFNSMLARAMAAPTRFVAIVRPSTLLSPDIFTAAIAAEARFGNFLLLAPERGRRGDAEAASAAAAAAVAQVGGGGTAQQRMDASIAVDAEKLGEAARRMGEISSRSKVGVWLWNVSPAPLCASSAAPNGTLLDAAAASASAADAPACFVPPFAFDRGFHDVWLARAALRASPAVAASSASGGADAGSSGSAGRQLLADADGRAFACIAARAIISPDTLSSVSVTAADSDQIGGAGGGSGKGDRGEAGFEVLAEELRKWGVSVAAQTLIPSMKAPARAEKKIVRRTWRGTVVEEAVAQEESLEAAGALLPALRIWNCPFGRGQGDCEEHQEGRRRNPHKQVVVNWELVKRWREGGGEGGGGGAGDGGGGGVVGGGSSGVCESAWLVVPCNGGQTDGTKVCFSPSACCQQGSTTFSSTTNPNNPPSSSSSSSSSISSFSSVLTSVFSSSASSFPSSSAQAPSQWVCSVASTAAGSGFGGSGGLLHVHSSGYLSPDHDSRTDQHLIDSNTSLDTSSSSSGAELQRKGLDDLLPLAVDHRNIVILVAATGSYASMLMSFVCNLRRLLLPLPLIAAFDDDMYRFASLHGLPVFRADTGLAGRDPSCVYGTPCFQRITKVKSRAVLQVLKRGVHVLWSDVDIVWFRDPLPEFLEFGSGVLPVQSDAGYDKEPPNGQGLSSPHGFINSGFYFARAEPMVIQAFEAIVAHAATTQTSEQPSFYHVLCGPKGEHTQGEDECEWPGNGLRIHFMDRWLHPNGLSHRVWFRRWPALECRKHRCATLHNNWVRGKENKLARLRKGGLWFYDPDNDMCRYNWYYETEGMKREEGTFLGVKD
ncbi:hypothetical protein CLOM_g6209 [Closterium sp. NIES-68]|nr:hypothetical protein CLOM_g6209 [Closterium sp. NIES-68]GJP66594.1 hypothetical protein CLOP_g23509 [Closterium sp. NIES-67]